MKVKIDRIAPEGEGIGHPKGSQKIVFVPHALPGEQVEVSAVLEKPQFLRAQLNAVLEPAVSRIEPKCRFHFKPGAKDYPTQYSASGTSGEEVNPARWYCGGCDWQHAAYDAQLTLKQEIVLDCMRRIAKLQVPVSKTLAAPSPWRYRNKVQVPFQPVAGKVLSGFYAPGSHRVIEFDDCVVQPELSVAIVNTVRDMVRRFGWSAYDEDRGEGWLRHLYLRTNSMGEAAVTFVTRSPAFPKIREMISEMTQKHPEVVSIWQNLQELKTSVILGRQWKKLWGKDRLSEKIGELVLEFSPGAFLQVNTPAAEVLYRTADTFLFEGGFKPALVLDIYSGIGAIAFWIARKVPRVIGVEESRDAVSDGYENARRLNARNVNFIQGKAELSLRRMKGLDARRPWAAVIDPPRAGCEPPVLKFLSEKRVDRIVYVSCNPATFARDAQRLVDSGYRLAKVQPVDLFPQTSHVELVAQFNRK